MVGGGSKGSACPQRAAILTLKDPERRRPSGLLAIFAQKPNGSPRATPPGS